MLNSFRLFFTIDRSQILRSLRWISNKLLIEFKSKIRNRSIVSTIYKFFISRNKTCTNRQVSLITEFQTLTHSSGIFLA